MKTSTLCLLMMLSTAIAAHQRRAVQPLPAYSAITHMEACLQQLIQLQAHIPPGFKRPKNDKEKEDPVFQRINVIINAMAKIFDQNRSQREELTKVLLPTQPQGPTILKHGPFRTFYLNGSSIHLAPYIQNHINQILWGYNSVNTLGH